MDGPICICDVLPHHHECPQATALSLAPALRIIAEVHGEQLDRGGGPYPLHLFRVALAMETVEEMVVALLHDAIEDCRNSCETMADIHEAYGQNILDAVQDLTHHADELYMDYIRRLSTNPLAVKIKLSDLADNMRADRLHKLAPATAIRLHNKYHEATAYLLGAKDAGFYPTEVADV